MKEDVERKYTYNNLRKDNIDKRDYIWEERNLVMSPDIPESFDLLNLTPESLSQGRQGSCGSFMAASAKAMLDGDKNIQYSPAFLYYKARIYEHQDIRTDYGTTLRSVCKTLKHDGVCLERYMKYDENLLDRIPSAEAIEDAKKHKISNYLRINNGLWSIKQYIYSQKLPILFGISIFESIFSDKVASTGIVPIPNEKKEKEIGNHALLCVGFKSSNTLLDRMINKFNKYHSSEGYLICLTSWGKDFGNNGIIYIPYEFITQKNLAYDFWVLEN